jgi:peroxiredoxin
MRASLCPLTNVLRFAFSALLFFCGCARHVVPPAPERAVDFTLPEVRGGSVSLSQFRGTPVLLHFWASWCLPCAHELELLQHFERSLGAERIRVVSVAIDSDWDAVSDIVRSRRIQFPVALDRGGSVREAFALTGVPQTVLLDEAGRQVPLPDPAEPIIAESIVGPREWARTINVERFREFLATRDSSSDRGSVESP